jgi:hypothetical protein
LPATPEKNNNQNQLDVQYADTAEDNMVDEGLSKDKFPYLRTLLRRCSSDTPYEHDLLARLFNHLSESPKFIKCIEEIDADGAYDGTLFIFQLLKHDGVQDVVHKTAHKLANHSPKLKQQLRSIADVLGDHSLKKVLYPELRLGEVYVDTTSIPDVYIDQKRISLVDCDNWGVWTRDKRKNLDNRSRSLRVSRESTSHERSASETDRDFLQMAILAAQLGDDYIDIRNELQITIGRSLTLSEKDIIKKSVNKFDASKGQSSSDMEVSNTEEERVKPVRKKSSPNALKKAGSEASLQVKKKRKLYELTVADVRMILEAKGAASDGLNLLTEDAVAFTKKGEKGTICFSSYFNRFFLDVGGGEIGFYAFGMSPEEKQMWREACCKDTQFSHFTMAMKKGKCSPQSTRNRWRCG